ncbi:MAG: hypothetical protein ACYDCL_19345 [Myxococcales bacterium]
MNISRGVPPDDPARDLADTDLTAADPRYADELVGSDSVEDGAPASGAAEAGPAAGFGLFELYRRFDAWLPVEPWQAVLALLPILFLVAPCVPALQLLELGTDADTLFSAVERCPRAVDRLGSPVHTQLAGIGWGSWISTRRHSYHAGRLPLAGSLGEGSVGYSIFDGALQSGTVSVDGETIDLLACGRASPAGGHHRSLR